MDNVQLHSAKSAPIMSMYNCFKNTQIITVKTFFIQIYASRSLPAFSQSLFQRCNSLKTLLTSTSLLEPDCQKSPQSSQLESLNTLETWVSKERHTLIIMPFWQTHRKKIFFWTIHNNQRISRNTGHLKGVLNQPQPQRPQHHLT